MFRSLNNMPIFRRIAIAFSLTVIISAVIVVLLSSFYLNALYTRDQAVKASFQAQSVAYQQQASLQRMNAFLQAYLAQVFASNQVGDPSLGASAQFIGREIKDREVTFDLTLTSYQQNYIAATSPGMQGLKGIVLSDDPNTTIIQQQRQLFNTVYRDQWPAYKSLQDQELSILTDYQNPANPAQQPTINAAYTHAYGVLYNANQTFLTLNNTWQQLVNIAQTMGEVVTNVGPSQTTPIYISTTIALFFTILVVVATGFVVNITITQPLRDLAGLTRDIAAGNTSARANISGRDEINQVATSMNAMLDNIVRLIQEAESRHSVLQAQIEKLVNEVSGVGEGDLSIQAEVTLNDLGVLADSFNYMIEELSNLIVRVKMLAYEVKNSTLSTTENMAQMVSTADMQIQQIGHATMEVQQMAGSSRQVAERAESLYKVAYQARRTAQGGRDAVQKTVAGIGRVQQNVQTTAERVQALDESSKKINEIISVISGIAQQTNRLALDASIQAAMAGENGKGFGAVASDIRRLAERAKEQVGMITQIVRNVREDINLASVSMHETSRETAVDVQLAQEAGTAIESIFSVVERQANEIEAINRMVAQQLQSSSSVVHIMQTVSESTQRSSYSTRATSEQMERLARQAEQLLATVDAFKLRQDQGPLNGTSVIMESPHNPMTVSSTIRPINGATPMRQIGRGPIPAYNTPRPERPNQSNMGYPAAYQSNGYGNGNGNSNGNGTMPSQQQQRSFPKMPGRPAAQSEQQQQPERGRMLQQWRLEQTPQPHSDQE